MSNSSYRVDADEYLVSLIAKHPGIYDKRSDYYKDYIRKQQSWDSIASQLNLDGMKLVIHVASTRCNLFQIFHAQVINK